MTCIQEFQLTCTAKPQFIFNTSADAIANCERGVGGHKKTKSNTFKKTVQNQWNVRNLNSCTVMRFRTWSDHFLRPFWNCHASSCEACLSGNTGVFLHWLSLKRPAACETSHKMKDGECWRCEKRSESARPTSNVEAEDMTVKQVRTSSVAKSNHWLALRGCVSWTSIHAACRPKRTCRKTLEVVGLLLFR